MFSALFSGHFLSVNFFLDKPPVFKVWRECFWLGYIKRLWLELFLFWDRHFLKCLSVSRHIEMYYWLIDGPYFKTHIKSWQSLFKCLLALLFEHACALQCYLFGECRKNDKQLPGLRRVHGGWGASHGVSLGPFNPLLVVVCCCFGNFVFILIDVVIRWLNYWLRCEGICFDSEKCCDGRPNFDIIELVTLEGTGRFLTHG